MRLIKSDKEAFVRSVLDDVPQIDYQAQVNKLVNDWAISKLPEQLVESVFHEVSFDFTDFETKFHIICGTYFSKITAIGSGRGQRSESREKAR